MYHPQNEETEPYFPFKSNVILFYGKYEITKTLFYCILLSFKKYIRILYSKQDNQLMQ